MVFLISLVIKRWQTLILLLAMSATHSVVAVTLEQAVGKALSDNPNMLAQYERYKASYYAQTNARGGFLPSLVLSGDAGKEKRTNTANTTTDLDRRALTLTLTQPIFHGGENIHSYSKSKKSLEQSYFQTLSAASQIALKSTMAYLEILHAQELIVMAEENLSIHKGTAEKVFNRQKQGVSDKADTSQIRGRIARAQANLNTARSRLADARTNYLTVVGDIPVNLIRPKPDASLLPIDRNEAVERALYQNPDLQESLFAVSVAEKSIKQAEAIYYPQFDFVWQRTEETDVDGLPGDQKDERAVIQMRWTLFNGMKNYSAVKSAKAQSAQSKMQSNGVRRQILQQVDLSWTAYRTNLMNADTLKEYVASAKQTEVLYTDQFSVNRRTLLDLLDSKNELFQARKTWLESAFELQKSKFRLLYVTGMLLKSFSINLDALLEHSRKDNWIDHHADRYSNHRGAVQ